MSPPLRGCQPGPCPEPPAGRSSRGHGQGQTYTPRSILARNMGTPEDQAAQFPPHKIIGNIYYVGTRTLSSFLVVTPQGNILIDSTYERNVPTIEKSVKQLGFKFSDIKILLGSHAHGDHQEGDALVKQMTGAQVMAMAEDVPALQAIKPGGKEHPIDKVLHDGEPVTLGGTTLVAHLTAGHTRGCTTWTTTGAGGRENLQCGIQLQLARAHDADARDCGRVQSLLQTGALTALRRTAGGSSRPVQHAGEIREATKGRRRIPSSMPPIAWLRRTSKRRCSTRSLRSSRPPVHRWRECCET